MNKTTLFISILACLIAITGLVSNKPSTKSNSAKFDAIEHTLAQRTDKLSDKFAKLEEYLSGHKINLQSADDEQNRSNGFENTLAKDFSDTKADIEKIKLALQELQLNRNTQVKIEKLILDPKQLALQEDIRQQQQHDLFESTFSSQDSDPDWSLQAVDKVKSSLALLDGLQIDNIECASTICKMTASTTSEGDTMDMYRDVDQKLAWPGQIYMSINENTGAMIAYLGREGNPLPNIEQ